MGIWDTQLQIMQENLCDLRKIAGWTAETLATKIGVTKQTISNLETQKVKLTRIQYIAIRSVFECEAASQSNNPTLRKVMGILFQAMPGDYESYRDKLRTAMVSIGSVSSAGITGLQLHASAVALLAPLGHVVSVADSMYRDELSLWWLQKLLDMDSSENNEAVKSNGMMSIDE